MNALDPVEWRADLIAAHNPAPCLASPDEIDGCLHACGVALVDLGGASQIDNARAVLERVVQGWPIALRPEAILLSKVASWVVKQGSSVKVARKGNAAPLHDRIEEAIAGRLMAVPWPWQLVSQQTQALMPGSVTIIVGTPGASKSFMLLQATLHWMAHGVRVSLYELEENPAFWMNRALAQLSKVGALTDPAWIAGHPELARECVHAHGDTICELSSALHTAPAEGSTLAQLADWIEEQAAAGSRIIMADPLTAAIESGGKPWESAQRFMLRAKSAAVKHGASLVFTTHGKKRDGNAKGPPDLDSLAGGSSYARFASCVLWLDPIEPTEELVMRHDGDEGNMEINRHIRILKAREGRGTGTNIAFQFQPESLTMVECGIVIKQRAQEAKPQKADASHQRARLKSTPQSSEDLFNTDAP